MEIEKHNRAYWKRELDETRKAISKRKTFQGSTEEREHLKARYARAWRHYFNFAKRYDRTQVDWESEAII